ncbi:hypothetical protein HK405_001585 [Cladochytrium tenue]|nr:hypothetical protein HK405_001585 [Cladochytrium tenue]
MQTLAEEIATVENLTSKVNELHGLVEKMKERERQLRMVNIIEMAISWKMYAMALDEFNAAKADKTELEREKASCEQRVLPLQELKDKAVAKRKEADQTSMKLKNKYFELYEKMTNLSKAAEKEEAEMKQIEKDADAASNEVSRKQSELKKLMEKRQSTVNEIQTMKQKLISEGILNADGSEATLSSQVSEEQQGELQEIQMELRKNTEDVNRLSQQIDLLNQKTREIMDDQLRVRRDIERAQEELTRVNSISNRKLGALRGSNQDAFKVVDWLPRIDATIDSAKQFIASEDERTAGIWRKKEECLRRRIAAVKKDMKVHDSLIDTFEQMTLSVMDALGFEEQCRRCERALDDAVAQNAEIMELFRRAKIRYIDTKAKAKELLEAAREHTKGCTPEDKDQLRQVIVRFRLCETKIVQLGDGKSLDELNTLLTSAKVRADLLGDRDGNVLEDFQAKSKELETRKATLEDHQMKSQTLGGEIDDLKGKWLPTLEKYFLITPKLLPDLDYHEKMKVLVIYNGDHQPDKLDIRKYLLARKSRGN